eukprot:12439192-Heterocapsa_arctica.AAC.1
MLCYAMLCYAMIYYNLLYDHVLCCATLSAIKRPRLLHRLRSSTSVTDRIHADEAGHTNQ